MNVVFEPSLPAAEIRPRYKIYDRNSNFAGSLEYETGNLFVGYTFFPIQDGGGYSPETIHQILKALDQLNGGKR